MNPPKISIITPSLNRAQFIEEAIQSVLAQDYPDVEHIIVDGGSTDGTLEILKRYPHLRVVSEPDSGMYEALNKGLGLVTGKIIGFLNSDDFYAPGIFAQIVHTFSEKGVDAVAGHACVVRHSNDIAHDMVMYRPAGDENPIEDTVLGAPIFNAHFFSKDVFREIGMFDARFKIVADRDFMIRFVLHNFNISAFDFPVYYYQEHPDSMTFKYTEAKYRRIVDEHLLLSKSYINAHSKFPHQLVKSLIEMRTRDTVRVCAHCLRQNQFRDAWFYLTEGFRYDPLWLIRFVRHATGHLIRQEPDASNQH